MVTSGERVCQGGELLPAGATALRLEAKPVQDAGSRLFVTLRREGRTLQTAPVQFGSGFSATAPLTPPAQDLDGVTVCLTVSAGAVALSGGPTPPGVGPLTSKGRPTVSSLPFTYLQPTAGSWWERISAVADRMALGRGDWGGGWIVWAVGGLLLASLALVLRVLVATVVAVSAAPAPARRRLPPLAPTIATIATIDAIAWSLITPAFQVPDEPTHIARAQQIAETGRPRVAPQGKERLAPELVAAMRGTRFGMLVRDVDARTFKAVVSSPLQQRGLERALHADLPRQGNGATGPAAPEPPLYYALEAIPYRIASGATLIDRMALMRLLSALTAGATALFALLFVPECLPGRPWAWSVGGLAVALCPLLGFISGGVNPDALRFRSARRCSTRSRWRSGVDSRFAAPCGSARFSAPER